MMDAIQNEAAAGCRSCVIAVFKRACQDCETGPQDLAVDAVQFLCSERAADWTEQLDLPPSAIAGLARRGWGIVRSRFDLTLADLENGSATRSQQ